MLKFSNKQKRGIEKLAGRHWDAWSPEVLSLYFAYTDRGIQLDCPSGLQGEYNLLMECHHFHSATLEMWKQDFKSGLLFLDDFLSGDGPLPYLQHVVDTYIGVMGWMPSKYLSVLKEKGVKVRLEER